jgi:hypothetical protein
MDIKSHFVSVLSIGCSIIYRKADVSPVTTVTKIQAKTGPINRRPPMTMPVSDRSKTHGFDGEEANGFSV